ncbi:MAG: 2,3-bisphosphoglycerate-dependent phosphoglycerate mutase [Clostridiales bacterium]|jgi:2,3-bisphosphoglycerate-dependent phosphoglycerate mutase|nr:2,3-bisphosphoglycerate-dependent phosphoglycerate mutase [Clostridiales bacterium]
MQLVLLRHGESIWNLENLFTGWTDVDLSTTGIIEAKTAGQTLKKEGFDFDICYTSYLKRAIHTLNFALDEMDRAWLPVIKTWKLNERHYGALQGLNKADTAEKYGDDQVKIWRRSFDTRPPLLESGDTRDPNGQEQYRQERDIELPLGESLKDTIARVMPYFKEEIFPKMLSGKRVLIAAHGNSLRALVQSLEGLSKEEVLELNIPTGVPLLYELDDKGQFISKRYLGDEALIQKKVAKVAAQGKAASK